MNKWARFGLFFVLLLALLVGNARPAGATDLRENGQVKAGEVIDDDVFLTGSQVVMDGTVNGLLFAAGETVTINGTVNGDALLFGKTIILSPNAKVTGNVFLGARTGKIEGSVSGSLFGGAADVTLAETALIERNLYYGGYSFQTSTGSTITRDLFLGGYQGILNGKVLRDVFVGSAALEVNGSIGRNLNVEVGEPTIRQAPVFTGQEDLPKAIDPGLRVSENAKIGGKLVYTSRAQQQETIKSAPAGGLVYQTPVPDQQGKTAPRPPSIQTRFPVVGSLLAGFRDLVTLLAFGALALWLLPAVFINTVNQARVRPAPSAGYGLLAIFSGYFSALVAVVLILLAGLLLGLISLGGLAWPVFGVGFSGLALFVALFTFLISTGSKLIVSYMVGQLLIDRAAPQTQNRQIWSLITGVVIYVLVSSIPFIGWLFSLAATLVGMGAMWLAYQARQKLAVPAVSETA